MVLVRFLNDEKRWQILTPEEKAELPEDIQEKKVFYIDGKLKEKLDFAMEQQKKSNDHVIPVVGDEGSGKSVLAVTMARYVSNDEFNPITDMIGDDEDGGFSKLERIKDRGVLVDDEAVTRYLGTDTMSKQQRNLTKIFSIIRQKELFVFIVLPSFFRLGSYFAVDRSKFMIRVYKKDGERSYFEYFGNKRKNRLYRIGKKLHDYGCVSPTFRGRFTKNYLLDNPTYLEFKKRTLRKVFESARPQNKPKSEYEIKQQIIKDFVIKNPDKSTTELGSFLHVTARRVRQIRQEHAEKEITDEK